MKIGGSTAWRIITQPISDRSLSDALIALWHGNPCPQVPQRHPRAIPVPSQCHPSAIPASSPHHPRLANRSSTESWPIRGLFHGHRGAHWVLQSVFGTATLPRGVSEPALRGETVIHRPLRRGDLAHRHFRGIPAWQRGYLSGLRHGHPAQRYLRAILAWQSVLLSGIRHDKLVHRYPRGIILWRSQTGHLPLLVHEIGFFHGR